MIGRTEDPARCAEIVGVPPGYWSFHQCRWKRGHGPDGRYCKQHGKIHEARSAREAEIRASAERNARERGE